MMVPVNLRGSDSAGGVGKSHLPGSGHHPAGHSRPRKLLAAVHREQSSSSARMPPNWSAWPVVCSACSRIPCRQLLAPFSASCRLRLSTWSALTCRARNSRSTCSATRCCTAIPMFRSAARWRINCAILTYDGTAYFGFSGDVHAAPDLRRLESFLKLSFTELREAARGQTAAKGRAEEREREQGASKAKLHRHRSAPQPVPASIRPPPLSSVESRVHEGPPVKEEKVLTQSIA